MAPPQSSRPGFQTQHRCDDTVAGHFSVPSRWQSLETWEELATVCSSHPDVWQDVGITHNASQEVRDLEFRLERGRRRGSWPSL